MKHTLLLVFLLLTGSYAARACTCIYIDSFCETITYDSDGINEWVKMVIRGKIVRQDQEGLTVAIVDLLHGEAPDSELRILSGNEADCRKNTNEFREGEEYLMALNESFGGYALSICGTTYLRIENETILAKVSPGHTNIPYHKLDELIACGDLRPGSPFGRIVVFPNPVAGDLQLRIEVAAPQIFTLSLANNLGQIVRRWPNQAFEAPQTVPLPIGELAAGLYYLRISDGEKRWTEKVVKVD